METIDNTYGSFSAAAPHDPRIRPRRRRATAGRTRRTRRTLPSVILSVTDDHVMTRRGLSLEPVDPVRTVARAREATADVAFHEIRGTPQRYVCSVTTLLRLKTVLHPHTQAHAAGTSDENILVVDAGRLRMHVGFAGDDAPRETFEADTASADDASALVATAGAVLACSLAAGRATAGSSWLSSPPAFWTDHNPAASTRSEQMLRHFENLLIVPQELCAVIASGTMTCLSVNLGVELTIYPMWLGNCIGRRAPLSESAPSAGACKRRGPPMMLFASCGSVIRETPWTPSSRRRWTCAEIWLSTSSLVVASPWPRGPSACRHRSGAAFPGA